MVIRPAALLSLLLTLSFLTSAFADAAERVDVVVGAQAPELEQFAARELAAMCKRLFDVKATVHRTVPEGTSPLVLVGSPETNPAVKQAAADRWPQLSKQGFFLRSHSTGGRDALLIGGGSPAATLWAVYEFGYQHGVRYLLRGDIYPETPVPLELGGIETIKEPALATRAWQTVDDLALGPASWSLDDQKRLVRQLAKLRFNRLVLSVHPHQPFVHYELQGTSKQSATLFSGGPYRVDGDVPGRAAFAGAARFENPDVAGQATYEEMTRAGENYLKGIIDAGQRSGMQVTLSIAPFEFPHEFTPTIADAKPTGHDSPLKALVATQIRAYLATYPTIDALCLKLTVHPGWDPFAADAWRAIQARLGPDSITLEDLIERAAGRRAGGLAEAEVRALKGNVVALALLLDVLDDSQLLMRPDGREVALVIAGTDPGLFHLLDRILPRSAAAMHIVDYTSPRVAADREQLRDVPAAKVLSQLGLSLTDDRVGILSQSATRRIEPLIEDIHTLGWDGLSIRHAMIAELDPTVLYLSRAAWDDQLTARRAHDELFAAITGKQSASDRMWLGLGHIEHANQLIDRHPVGFARSQNGMLMSPDVEGPLPDAWEELVASYTQAMTEFYRSHDAAHPRSRKLLYYYAKRSEFVVDYLNCVNALRTAAAARQEENAEEAVTQLETAMESIYNALDTLGDVVRDPSDRGLIAVLIANAYRPMAAEYDLQLAAAESAAPAGGDPKPAITLVSCEKIWDRAPHNAFTNLIRYDDRWFCVFREGAGHVSPDGALRVITSSDGQEWESAARITSDKADLRDAQITVTPDNRLMLSGAAALHQPAKARHQSMAYFSEDGRKWSPGIEIGDPDFWLWRVTWHKKIAYGIGYCTTEKKSIRLYKSRDGRTFDTLVENLLDREYPNETSVVFLEDDSAVCLLRRQGPAMVGMSQPPYKDWTWKDLGVPIGGPHMLQLPDGRFITAVRLYDGGPRTSLCWLDPHAGTLDECLKLPSGGDTSYAGLVWHDGLLWVSYYSSHEGKTSIYLAKVKI